MNIIVFGMSTTWGAWDAEGGWVDRLKKYCNQKVIDSNYEKYLCVFNLGISGDTTEDLVKRSESELEPRIQDEEVVLIYAIGCNDGIFNPKDKQRTPRVSLEKYEENLKTLIALGKEHKAREIIFIGNTPHNEEKTLPVSWDEKVAYSNDILAKYKEVMERVCNEQGVTYIEMWDLFPDTDRDKSFPDGVHPSTEAHEKMFYEVNNFLEAKKLI